MSSERTIHPAGVHDAKVLDHGIGRAKSGTTQLTVKFETEHGTITGWFSLTDRAAEYTIEKVVAMGFQGTNLSELNDGACLVGNPCSITVKHEDYKGRMGAKVHFVNPPGYEGKDVSRDTAAAQSANAFNALLRTKQKKNGGGKSSPPSQQTMGNTDDDNPPF